MAAGQLVFFFLPLPPCSLVGQRGRRCHVAVDHRFLASPTTNRPPNPSPILSITAATTIATGSSLPLLISYCRPPRQLKPHHHRRQRRHHHRHCCSPPPLAEDLTPSTNPSIQGGEWIALVALLLSMPFPSPESRRRRWISQDFGPRSLTCGPHASAAAVWGGRTVEPEVEGEPEENVVDTEENQGKHSLQATMAALAVLRHQRRPASSWAAAVADHACSGRHAAALTVFRRVLRAHPAVATSDQLAYAALLRCHDRRLAYQIHAQVCRRGLAASNPVLACSLLAFYAECVDTDSATRVFDEMSHLDAVSYTAMISALLRAGECHRAFALYPRMLPLSAPTQHTFSRLLAACASMRLRRYGTQLHAQLLRWGCWGPHLSLVLKTALLHMYAACGAMASARTVLHATPETDVVLWTAIIAAYSRGGQLQPALRAFRDMERAAVPPNAFTYAALIAACSAARSLHIGRLLHARLFKFHLEHDTSACNALLDLYSKCSTCFLDLLHAFCAVGTPNVVSWTAFIAGLVRHGRDQEAFAAFARMRAAGVQPNSFTVSTLLKGCTSAQAYQL
nr:unnamed protein product [Digitaria exilis]